MDSASNFVVVGAGQAGAELCAELRRQGYEGRITLIGEERSPPYKRPPLSKAYLSGSVAEEALHVATPELLRRTGTEFVSGVRVNRIVREAHKIELADGRQMAYGKLALTTGARARSITVPGAGFANVSLLRTVEDVQAVRPHLAAGRRLVVVGGGFIGLEAAAVAVRMGLQVTVIEELDRVLSRATSAEVSRFLERVHDEEGVHIRTRSPLKAILGSERAEVVLLQDGTEIPADYVLVGVGVIPNVELAQWAGLEVDNGIVVDECARTADPDIVAAGDCTSHPSEYAGRRLRLESVQNALDQARVAAKAMLGRPQPYRSIPWFWSDQYDVKLQMVGLSAGHDHLVLRGDPRQGRSFAVLYLRQGRLIAVDTVNRPKEFMVAKKLVAAVLAPDPSALADESRPLEFFLEREAGMP